VQNTKQRTASLITACPGVTRLPYRCHGREAKCKRKTLVAGKFGFASVWKSISYTDRYSCFAKFWNELKHKMSCIPHGHLTSFHDAVTSFCSDCGHQPKNMQDFWMTPGITIMIFGWHLVSLLWFRVLKIPVSNESVPPSYMNCNGKLWID